MKSFMIALGLVSWLVSGSLFACDIVDKSSFHRGFQKGVKGVCSNNNSAIKCYYSGQYQGGLTCSGPLGTNSGYSLQDLIAAVCGCEPGDDADSPENQLEQELE